jgi:hypothetical protein
MALIVEDGTGLLNSESYASVAFATQYFADRGVTAWGALASDTVREQLLRLSTDFMVSTYRNRWQGVRWRYNQALDWPRANVWRDDWDMISVNVVPTEVQQACAELALLASTQALLTGVINRSKKSIKLGPLEIEYDGDSEQLPRFANAVRRLGPLLSGGAGGNMARLSRA